MKLLFPLYIEQSDNSLVLVRTVDVDLTALAWHRCQQRSSFPLNSLCILGRIHSHIQLVVADALASCTGVVSINRGKDNRAQVCFGSVLACRDSRWFFKLGNLLS